MIFTGNINPKDYNLQKITPSENKSKKKACKIDELYAYIGNISLYGRLYDLMDTYDAGEIISKVDAFVLFLDESFGFDFRNDKNIWFKSYLTNYISSNLIYQLKTGEEKGDVDKVLNRFHSLFASLSEQAKEMVKAKPIKTDMGNHFNLQMFYQIETLKLATQISNKQAEIIKDYQSSNIDEFNPFAITNKDTIKLDKNFLNLFYEDGIEVELIPLIFECVDDACEKDERFLQLQQWLIDNELNTDNDFNPLYVNSRINILKFSLFKSYYYFVAPNILNEYAEAVKKTYQHYLSLDKQGQLNFKEKFKSGIPIVKFKQSVEKRLSLLWQIIENQSKDKSS